MAASSSLSRTWGYRVFTSFHGPDVRKTFLSHLRKQFNLNAISMFDDERIERSQTIAPTLKQAIRDSRISIVVLSKNYASSGWCLNELVEILNCKEEMGQIVMTVFYGVDPSDVRKQTGEFGNAFNETCAGKTKEERRIWSQALNDVGNIAGEHLLNWKNEAKMIEKMARDVLYKLNATPPRDFDEMVGLEAHLTKMQSLLDFDYQGVMMVAISGSAGIGKTTIARALHSLLSNRFQLSYFVDNLRESYHTGFDKYGLMLCLQEQFLSKVLNQNGMRIYHLGAIKENLCDQKVLIILDDVHNLNQLEALAGDISWFGPGSRIVVTTENQELLQQHDIDKIYHVEFPSHEAALKILCRYAFRETSPRHGFKELAESVTELCGNLPLALRVVGSSLRGKNEDGWKYVMNRLETILDRDIEDALRVGYESLEENEKTLFLHIAVFFNYNDSDLVNTMFDDLGVKFGLKILVNRSLIEIPTYSERIVMHKLLQQVARQVIRKQEPWKRQILMDANDICDALKNETDTRAVSGISFDISGIDEIYIGESAFKRMPNLRFLSVYKTRYDGNGIVYIPEEMELPRQLRLLHWEAYPSKCLPPKFHPEYLVELVMQNSKLEKLWEGNQPFTNLKKMDLSWSINLKELPDLSTATNMEKLELKGCECLVEIPSSFSHLHKLRKWGVTGCINLQVIPAHMNLASLEDVDMGGCSRLRDFPVMSMNIKEMDISKTVIEDVPTSIRLCSRLESLNLSGSGKLKNITHLPTSLTKLNLGYSDIERIPDCITGLHQLKSLGLRCCRRLASLPKLPDSLNFLFADDCESLETVFCTLKTSHSALYFANCFKLDELARRAIIQPLFFLRGRALLPGREVPIQFDHRARGNSLIIHLDGKRSDLTHYINTRFVVCVVISCTQETKESTASELSCRCIAQGTLWPVCDCDYTVSNFGTEHLFIFHPYDVTYYDPTEASREIILEFSSKSRDFNIIECGARILTDERIKRVTNPSTRPCHD